MFITYLFGKDFFLADLDAARRRVGTRKNRRIVAVGTLSVESRRSKVTVRKTPEASPTTPKSKANFRGREGEKR